MKVKVKLPKPRKEPSPPPTDRPKQPTRLARMLALAHLIERKVESGELNDYAEAARTLGISRARMTQVMNLLVLSPTVQEQVLRGGRRLTERLVRPLVKSASWEEHSLRIRRGDK